jgi:hypothetical protein
VQLRPHLVPVLQVETSPDGGSKSTAALSAVCSAIGQAMAIMAASGSPLLGSPAAASEPCGAGSHGLGAMSRGGVRLGLGLGLELGYQGAAQPLALTSAAL